MEIYCVNIQEYVEAHGGETLADVGARIAGRLGFEPVCARVNNRNQDLGYPLYGPKMVEFLDAASPSGQRVIIRSLCMLLYKAITDTLPGARLSIEHSICGGHYCRLRMPDGSADAPAQATLDAIAARMRELKEADIPFVRKERLTADVADTFRAQGLDDKVLLLETTHPLYSVYYRLGDTADSYYGPLLPSTGRIGAFALHPFKSGFLLMPPQAANPAEPARRVEMEKMFGAFTDYVNVNRMIGVSNAGQLNRAVEEKRAPTVVNIVEAMHFKYLARIADRIADAYSRGGARIVLLAGPSSSGKTTTSKRLAIQLATNLITPKIISLDDYFVDRAHTPRDASGDYDYEHLHALDLAQLNADISDLLAGKEINLPTYSFEFGRRIDRPRPLRLDPGDVLVMEGIHGLNPELLADIDPAQTFKVYVSALTTLSVDDHNWISTTDTRLLRRIVRDHRYRHTSAIDTIRRWPSVRRGEEKWIFPYQENADATFNSSLIYELAVIKDYAMPILDAVPADTPEYAEAARLRVLLNHFNKIPVELIPSTSVLREFLGGSSFKY